MKFIKLIAATQQIRQDLVEFDQAQHGTYKHTIAQTQVRYAHTSYATK